MPTNNNNNIIKPMLCYVANFPLYIYSATHWTYYPDQKHLPQDSTGERDLCSIEFHSTKSVTTVQRVSKEVPYSSSMCKLNCLFRVDPPFCSHVNSCASSGQLWSYRRFTRILKMVFEIFIPTV